MQAQPFVQSYAIICSVGDGSQGHAFLARQGDKSFVIKLYLPSARSQEYFSKQVQILSHITSPHIIRMIDHYAEARTFLAGREELRPAIVLEFAEHGELFKLVNLQKFSQEVSRTLFLQLLQAIKHMKDLNITHRDIKLENILLDQRFNLKLADFGFARSSLGNNHDFYLRSWRGTESYMAPEIHNRLYQGEKVDLFAAGVVLFLMFIRIPPFENTEVSNQKYNLIREGKIARFWAMFERKSKPLSVSFKHLIDKLFLADPNKRPTIQQVLQDEWVNGKILTNEELQAYMQPRYDKLSNKDEETRNIRRNMRQNLERMVNQHERVNEQRERSREGVERRPSGNRGESQIIEQDILHSKITHKNVPEIKSLNLAYAKITPTMALLWLNHYLSNMKQSKEQLIKDSIDEVEFSGYQLHFDRNGKIDLTISLDITSEVDSAITELKLKGQILNYQGQICISWKGEVGNAFWLYEIIESLNSQFSLTFI